MTLDDRFSEAQLLTIIDEATIYMCACPAQVAQQILKMRGMVRYQQECETSVGADSEVHRTIAQAGIEALRVLEDCLDTVLTLEGWDRSTMKMPEGLRARRDQLAGGS